MSSLSIEFPESLPVSARRDEIAAAIAKHQVVIVCGETGSGKTTQLPKIALSLGRGKLNYPPGRGRLIGHTQPRRIAASSVAKRIAEELKTPLGEVVGFKVRFQDRLSRDASVKLMTDGILLAETQTDPDLKAYDTLIIDEAHERSLNIDFLLGYLKQLLPRRPDLKIIVTSATIDADRFARHFESRSGPAPVIMVSGRLFPVEQRYRPFEEGKDFDLNDAIADAVDELWREPHAGGDILVFLPGEREIREAADHLRRHTASHMRLRHVDVIPLFARLSQAEQDAVFESHSAQRIVLATNVAETSLTVPGINYVIDAGTARVKRYSYRSKVEQLQVEAISQAAANQRAGRCGRVANGICIRLYDEKDFASRDRFTDPEILRSSLASVILRMKAMRLGGVEDFPFIEPPSGRAIADGYQLLQELGAVDEGNELTALGAELARLPLDPRVGRMILAARDNQALEEVLIIASALSVQDARDRPMGQEAAADTAQKKFDDERSEFVGYLKLWKWLEDSRGGHGKEHKLSNRQYENLLRQNYVNPRRVREWRDIHSQLLTVVTEHRWKLNTSPATYEQLHTALLTGLLGNIGYKPDDATSAGSGQSEYLGARGIKFYRHPGAKLSKKPGRWVMGAELVETTRLFARGLANIEPQWIERVGAHLLKKQLLDPHWEKKAAEVTALERATLYGIVIYNNRRKSYGLVDPHAAREIFIRQALVDGEWDTKLPFLAHNQKLVKQVEDLEHKARRQDVLVDDELIYAYYDAQLPADVFSGHTMERWYRDASRDNPKLLWLTREELMRHEAAGITTEAFPKTIRLGGVDCHATYLHEPGNAKDGVTVEVPLFVLNQVNDDRCEWLVPGMLKDKVQALLKSLPQRSRGRLVPLPDSAQRLSAAMAYGDGALSDALLKAVRDDVQLDVKRTDFKLDMLQAHHFMNFRVVDEHGRQMGTGRSLGALKAELGAQARGAFQALATLKPAVQPLVEENKPLAGVNTSQVAIKSVAPAMTVDAKYTAWTFGELPELMEIKRGVQSLIGFPALIDLRDAVSIEVFDEPDAAAEKHRAGLRRLFALQIKDALKYLEKNIPDLQKMSVAYMGLGTAEELREQIVDVALDRAFLLDPLPTDAQSFQRRVDEGRGRLTLIANEVARLCNTVLTEYASAARKIKDTKNAPEAAADAAQQLQRLLPKKFILQTPYTTLQHLPRYLKAITLRLEKYRADPARDAAKLAELRPQEQRYWRLFAERKGHTDARMQEFRWLLEELRVSFFAQELRTPQPVSVKRLDKAWVQINS
jgi:ATP-dependent helicase HrpA